MKTEKKAIRLLFKLEPVRLDIWKVLAEIEGKPLIEYLIERLKRSLAPKILYWQRQQTNPTIS